MREFIDTAYQGNKIASNPENLFEKRNFLKATRSNLTLKDKIVHCSWQKPWAALCAATTSRKREQDTGVEPVSLPWEGSIEPLN